MTSSVRIGSSTNSSKSPSRFRVRRLLFELLSVPKLATLPSYRSCLDQVGVSVAVQKELMRYASITTTMNLYGTVLSESKREANRNVVQMNVALQKSDLDQRRAA
jgi:hypothetical protein